MVTFPALFACHVSVVPVPRLTVSGAAVNVIVGAGGGGGAGAGGGGGGGAACCLRHETVTNNSKMSKTIRREFGLITI
jgi:hypothetical protein